jgi:hypothetical protein
MVFAAPHQAYRAVRARLRKRISSQRVCDRFVAASAAPTSRSDVGRSGNCGVPDRTRTCYRRLRTIRRPANLRHWWCELKSPESGRASSVSSPAKSPSHPFVLAEYFEAELMISYGALAASILEIPAKEFRHTFERIVACGRVRAGDRNNASGCPIRWKLVHRVIRPVEIVIRVRVYSHLDL